MRTRKPTNYPVLDDYMDRHGLFQYEFANKIGMKQGDLSKRLHDILPWTPEWRDRIAGLVDLPVEEAFRKEVI